MTFVSCHNTECIHCDMKDYHCTKTSIAVGEHFDGGCIDLEPYYNSEDYSHKYYICVKTKSGELAKAVKYGKRIEYNDRVFLTTERITEYRECNLTDAVTGYGVGMYRNLEERFPAICEKAKSVPNVETLPLAEWDNGGYILVKEDQSNDPKEIH